LSNYPSPAKVVVGSDRIVKVTISRARAYYSKAGIQDLVQGTREVTVDFDTPMADANWVYGSMCIVNSADPAVDVQQISVIGRSAPSQGGFDLLLSAAPLSGNYKLHWQIAEAYNP
jgi:hypothetical protein